MKYYTALFQGFFSEICFQDFLEFYQNLSISLLFFSSSNKILLPEHFPVAAWKFIGNGQFTSEKISKRKMLLMLPSPKF